MNATSTTLTVARVNSLRRDVFRAYQVLVDGSCVATVKRGKTVSLPIAPGDHAVQIKIDWCTSPELQVTVANGGDLRLACGPNPTDQGALRQVVSNPSSYLWLTETP